MRNASLSNDSRVTRSTARLPRRGRTAGANTHCWHADTHCRRQIRTTRTECHRRIGCRRIGVLLQHKALRVSDHSQRFCACRATAISAGISLRGFLQRLLHKGESLCCFRDSASVTYGGMLPSDLTLSALRFILSAKSGQSCKQDCETVDFCNSLIQYVKERRSSEWRIRTSGTTHPLT